MVGVAAALIIGGGVLWSQRASAEAGLFPYDDPVAVAKGEVLYAENCAACHGAALEGQGNWRERDADGYLPAPPHDRSGHTWHHPDQQLFAITKYGSAALVGNGYQSRMGGFGEVLSDADILRVLAYIKSTWPGPVVERHNQINAAAAKS
ncbi:Cytochrome C oxidase, cbb3-type, subunit III [Thalassovita taeanensis]|uniref:Cytochrome C oxidase, cbb3-type, subunit III n=1 Tax=Thalassovita taeanensis TaxID=657014 RepID=A0A1H9B3E7_9RHOB|nr:Cytochrome C oxidase, cbb3-type, subunit III [Thalassovita taeanensis]